MLTFHSAFIFTLAALAQVNKILLVKFPSKGLNDDVMTPSHDNSFVDEKAEKNPDAV
jgi:hypothetical protein